MQICDVLVAGVIFVSNIRSLITFGPRNVLGLVLFASVFTYWSRNPHLRVRYFAYRWHIEDCLSKQDRQIVVVCKILCDTLVTLVWLCFTHYSWQCFLTHCERARNREYLNPSQIDTEFPFNCELRDRSAFRQKLKKKKMLIIQDERVHSYSFWG